MLKNYLRIQGFKNEKLEVKRRNMYKKNLFLVLIIYISSYIFNYIYTNKILHFLDWYYLITILFICLWNYVVDKKSKKNMLILYGIST